MVIDLAILLGAESGIIRLRGCRPKQRFLRVLHFRPTLHPRGGTVVVVVALQCVCTVGEDRGMLGMRHVMIRCQHAISTNGWPRTSSWAGESRHAVSCAGGCTTVQGDQLVNNACS